MAYPTCAAPMRSDNSGMRCPSLLRGYRSWILGAMVRECGFVVGDNLTLVVIRRETRWRRKLSTDTRPPARPGGKPTAASSNTEKHFDHIGGNGFFSRAGHRTCGPRWDCANGGGLSSRNRGVQTIRSPTRLAGTAMRRGRSFHGTHPVNPNRRLTATLGSTWAAARWKSCLRRGTRQPIFRFGCPMTKFIHWRLPD